MSSARDSYTKTLNSGLQVQIERTGPTMQLLVDGTPQSHLNLEDPTQLSFGYIRHMGHVIDLAFDKKKPITAIHLGAGALTIPRYIEETRPGSRQQVIEIERELVEFVREVAPLPPHASIRLRYGDAREQLAKLPRGLEGAAEVMVIDIFAGSQTPAHVTSVEFFTEASRFLAPDGVMLVNVTDGHDLTFARNEVATIRAAIGPVLLLSDPAVFKGRRFGNIVVAAAREELELPGLARLAAGGFPPASVQHDAQAVAWMRDAQPTTDDNATASPKPGRGTFSVRR